MMERPWFLTTRAEPSQRPASIRRLGLGIAAAMALLFVGLQGWWVPPAAPGLAVGPRGVEIPPQMGLVAMARRLDEARVIRSPVGFVLLAITRGSARTRKDGQ